jgi:hypothetical protein
MAKRKRQTEYAVRHQRRLAKLAEGICIDCPHEAQGGVRCRACAVKASARARRFYHANAEKCRRQATARYHANHPEARYWGPRKKAA